MWEKSIVRKISYPLAAGVLVAAVAIDGSPVLGVYEYYNPQPHTEQQIPVSENNINFVGLATATNSTSDAFYALPSSDLGFSKDCPR